MTNRWSDRESDRLRVLHAEGKSLHAIADEMQRSKQTIYRYAKRLNLTFGRESTARATEALVTDTRARRAALERRLLDEADASLDRMWDGMEVGQFAGMDGEYKTAWIDEPSPADRAKIMQTAAAALVAANRLSELISDGRELSAVDAWVKAMTSGDG